jgi:hypothetical protein
MCTILVFISFMSLYLLKRWLHTSFVVIYLKVQESTSFVVIHLKVQESFCCAILLVVNYWWSVFVRSAFLLSYLFGKFFSVRYPCSNLPKLSLQYKYAVQMGWYSTAHTQGICYSLELWALGNSWSPTLLWKASAASTCESPMFGVGN